MTILDQFRRFATISAHCLCMLALAGCMAPSVRAQATQAWVERVALLRSQIKSAEEQHAGPVQLGELWLALANRYQDQLQYPQAEDAFARALRLLKGAGAEAQYADALDGMGSIDRVTKRPKQAEAFTRSALKIYETLEDRLNAAKMHEDLALDMEFEQRHRDAVAESSAALTALESLARTDPGQIVAAHLTRSIALCSQRRCSEGLEDAKQAMAMAQAKFPAESLEMMTATLMVGIDEWRSGSPTQGEQAMQEALWLARGLKDLPPPVSVDAQLWVMRQYEVLLKASHRNPEAKDMEAEIGRLGAEQSASCTNCTVSAAAFALLP